MVNQRDLAAQAQRNAQEIEHYLALLDAQDGQQASSSAARGDVQSALNKLQREGATIRAGLERLVHSGWTRVVLGSPTVNLGGCSEPWQASPHQLLDLPSSTLRRRRALKDSRRLSRLEWQDVGRLLIEALKSDGARASAMQFALMLAGRRLRPFALLSRFSDISQVI